MAAAVPFYGVYDLTNADGVYYPELRDNVLEPYVFKARFADAPERFRDASPTFRIGPDAPPFLDAARRQRHPRSGPRRAQLRGAPARGL